jgi:predicted dithiol-disulfide oxidoreductase (DUF899 family)
MSEQVSHEEIVELEKAVREAKEKLREALKRAEAEPVQDYTLRRSTGEPVALSALFGDKSDLLVIHNMGRRCPYCTLWADGLNGLLPHLENRSGVVLVSPDPPDVQAAFAEERGWKFAMCSGRESAFTGDMGFVVEGMIWPGVSAFHKRADGSIVRTNRTFFGPGDDFCAAWPLFDLLKDGVNNWEPEFAY